ncbi:MAG: hypothetical protein HXX16_12650 [Bacteroidales bacterium]|nr:hypothetical protein [Bacteroidales bacterium]
MLFDENDNLIVDGWMEFILEGDFFIAFWKFLEIYENGKCVFDKNDGLIPEHVKMKLPDSIKHLYTDTVKGRL